MIIAICRLRISRSSSGSSFNSLGESAIIGHLVLEDSDTGMVSCEHTCYTQHLWVGEQASDEEVVLLLLGNLCYSVTLYVVSFV